jgi:hypothetical protein
LVNSSVVIWLIWYKTTFIQSQQKSVWLLLELLKYYNVINTLTWLVWHRKLKILLKLLTLQEHLNRTFLVVSVLVNLVIVCVVFFWFCVFVFVLCLVCPMLPVSLDSQILIYPILISPILISPSGFSNVYFIEINISII